MSFKNIYEIFVRDPVKLFELTIFCFMRGRTLYMKHLLDYISRGFFFSLMKCFIGEVIN